MLGDDASNLGLGMLRGAACLISRFLAVSQGRLQLLLIIDSSSAFPLAVRAVVELLCLCVLYVSCCPYSNTQKSSTSFSGLFP